MSTVEEIPSKNGRISVDPLGASVYHLKHVFLETRVCSCAKFNRASRVNEIENLQGDMGVIRKTSSDTICPIDGRKGAAYIHCLEGNDHVGKATHMLSYSWRYVRTNSF